MKGNKNQSSRQRKTSIGGEDGVHQLGGEKGEVAEKKETSKGKLVEVTGQYGRRIDDVKGRGGWVQEIGKWDDAEEGQAVMK